MREEELAELLSLLHPAPHAWVAAAQALPHTLADLNEVVARLEQDRKLRRMFEDDPRTALERAGVRAGAAAVAALRAQIAPDV